MELAGFNIFVFEEKHEVIRYDEKQGDVKSHTIKEMRESHHKIGLARN